MLYNQLEWLLHPFFLSRWWSSLAWIDNIETYINLAIQDVYNEWNWSWIIKYEKISNFTIENWFKRFVSEFDIEQIIECKNMDWDDLYAVSWIIDRHDWYNRNFRFSWKNIYFSENSNIEEFEISYVKKYIWYNSKKDWTNPIPLDDKFIPAILKSIYDYTSPINLFEWEQTQVDYFWHYTNRINKLKDKDALSESTQFIPTKDYY